MKHSLIGYVRYRSHLWGETDEKRTGGVTPPTDSAGCKRKAWQMSRDSPEEVIHVDEIYQSITGWIFITESSDKVASVVYLASFPANLLTAVAHAAENNERVRLCKYNIRQVKTKQSSNRDSQVFWSIEVHPNGLERDPTSMPLMPHRMYGTADAPCWNLAQLSKLDFFERSSRIKLSKHLSFEAHVRIVSPIIAYDPTDPFCLMELWQETSSAIYSVVVVVRKDSLMHWPNIRPGQHIIIVKALNQAWQVPYWFAESNNRPRWPPPDRVFVVEQPTQLFFPGVPSPPENKFSFATDNKEFMRGKIVDVQYVRLSRNHTAVNYVELEIFSATNVDGSTPRGNIFVFLTHFPMDMSLWVALRVGVQIVVHSVKCLEDDVAFEATLRSSIFVESFPSNLRQTQPTTIECNPFYFSRKIRFSCLDAWRRVEIGKCLRESFGDSAGDQWTFDVLESDIYRTIFIAKDNFPTTHHNPYASFFECHHHDRQGITVPGVAVETQDDPDDSEKRTSHSKLLPLHSVREKALEKATLWVREQLKDSNHSTWAGWRATLRLCTADVGGEGAVYTCGISDSWTSEKSSLINSVMLRNDQASITVSSESIIRCRDQSVVLLRLSSVVVTLFSLGRFTNGLHQHVIDLPCYNRVASLGNLVCSRLVHIDGVVFFVSVILLGEVAAVLLPTAKESCLSVQREEPHRINRKKPIVRTIKDCLFNLPQNSPLHQELVSALLVRMSVRFKKAPHLKFGGLCLTLAHIPSSQTDATMISSIQSIEIKPLLLLEKDKQWKMRHFLKHIYGQSTSEELVDTATAWWKLSEQHMTSAVVTGGWDEYVGPFLSTEDAPRLGVVVYFPLSSLKHDTKRGYVRYRGKMDDILVVHRYFPGHKTPGEATTMLEFIGGRKFFPGMLDRCHGRLGQQARHELGQRVLGELTQIPKASSEGMPFCSIGSLHKSLCDDLREGTRYHTAPSLVRGIRNANFLGISFCQVYAECSKCFKALVGRGRGQRGRLVCPNECDQKNFRVRFECSGVLDDGSGQAKLYAERDAALTLLGMDQSTIDYIEQGAWKVEGGLIYLRNVPVKPHIRSAVEIAKSMARRSNIDKSTILKLMDPVYRAEYLLEYHCRRSSRPLRPLVYYVRCKPLSDSVRTVNHTEVINSAVTLEDIDEQCHKQAVSRKTVTYALPPLKLNLVDMARC